jgi:ATP-dependent DNA helicase RecQ
MPSDPLQVLKTIYGYSAFRGPQAAIVDHVIAGNNAFVLMPTGGGKSLCYQIPALCRPGLGLVVSPLIALMSDQVAALVQAGVRASALNSNLEHHERGDLWQAIDSEALDLLYVAPETLLKPETLSRLRGVRLSLIAIDEAHCLSQWGHDFRPHYRQLDRLAGLFPDTPRMALTATADEPTRAEILDHLRIDPRDSFVVGFDRPNIRYAIEEKTNARKQLLAFLDAHKGESGIVYCLSRQTTEDTADFLKENGYKALAYHAGMETAVRERRQARFQREDAVVMVATVAFGMGIDKPNVRFVAHLDLPGSIEAYYQETGRAGRDGLPADALLLYGAKDADMRRRFIERSDAPEERRQVERQKLDALIGLAEAGRCRRQILLDYFGDSCEPCGNCDTCAAPPRMFDGTTAAQKVLSCIHRTGERFGQTHVINVLLGEADERIRRLGHDQLSTFGIGREHDRTGWRLILRQLVARGLVVSQAADHGGLSISQEGRRFLRDKGELTLRTVRQLARTTARIADRKAPASPLSESDGTLFEALRAKRLDIARLDGVPPYVIFHDRTLMEMAAARPRTLAELSGISGVGQAKLDRYGYTFLAVIAAGEDAAAEAAG